MGDERKEMKRYRITMQVAANITIEVEAENEDMAKNKAEIPSLCFFCSQTIEFGSDIDALEAEEIKDEDEDEG